MPRRAAALCLAMIVATATAVAGAGMASGKKPGRLWHAGAYSFSDELGGFTIKAVSGIGTREHPIVIAQELNSASPVTMVIRATRKIKPFALAGDYANGILHMRIETFNASGLPWLEFEFELQEVLRKPSVYGDGLSFDQRRTDSTAILSDRFNKFDDTFEPHDRLVYFDGHVDALDTASFRFMITDFTPQPEFYLLQDPRIPAS